ncbi:alpha-L-rhamnosidase [Cohnella hashimotonis]|uniref:alpha-L-rhamnosidase n=1 Tax=Cohnella hashimotonis TaxID=2826895 RepID=A0ABT6TH83_9BACL|nr:alpha-L-rhamnosidase [Cohnella hashimotonis]MDI4645653.1 family 78 glycoside hydrolase catalytic domain [Cohnella hashimotonis]
MPEHGNENVFVNVFKEAAWIAAPVADHRDWDEYAVELTVVLEAGTLEILFGVRSEARYSGCALDAEFGSVTLFGFADGIRTELARAAAPELTNSPGAIRIRLERSAEEVAVNIGGRTVLCAREPGREAGTIGFRAGSGGSAVCRDLRVVAPDGRHMYVNRFYDPAVIQFGGGRIDGSGSGLRLDENVLAVCEAQVASDSPLLRKQFELQSPVVRAELCVYALGWYEVTVNGAKPDARLLTPANAPYERRLLYDVYDVTSFLKAGTNAVGLWLGNGYNMNYSRWGWKWKRGKAVALTLTATLEDGSTRTLGTDESWLTGPSPLLANDIYDGEIFDARLAQPGWNLPEFAALGWARAVRAAPPEGELLRNEQPQVRAFEPLRPVRVLRPRDGVAVYDFGQNIAGWAKAAVRGSAGTRVELRYSELIDADGAIDPWTNRNAKATDIYILGGSSERETYEPRFTYHGFRYVEVRGDAELLELLAVPVHADVEEAGEFNCSDETLVRIQRNLRWSILNNLYSIPTDCCQRDERTPCLMDSAVVEEAAIHNFGMQAYYRKWLGDISHDAGNPDWSGDKVTLPWYLYQYYGDRETLETSYPSMSAYVDTLAAKWPAGIVEEGFGDWCVPNDDGWENYFNEVAIVNSALYGRFARIVSQAAEVCGHAEEAMRFSALAERIGEAFQSRFHDGNGIYGSGSQTAQLMPLAFGMVPSSAVDKAFQGLLAAIEAKGGRLDTGIYGTRYLMDVLADHGCIDLALALLTQPEYPGFGYQIAQGATTLWEQWSEKGGMHSHDHAMFGGIGASFYTRLGGIEPLSPGYDSIRIRPNVPSCLQWARTRLKTVKGEIVSDWTKEGNALRLDVEIPAGATAVVVLPGPKSGTAAAADERRVGPGKHAFVVASAAAAAE